MKLLQSERARIAAAIAPLDTEPRRAAYRAAGLSDMRYRWDLLHAGSRAAGWWISELYVDGIADSHIDTALRSIVRPLVAR